MAQKMGKKGPSSRKGDPDWKPRKLSVKIDKKVAPRDAKKLPITKHEIALLGDELIAWAEQNKGTFSINGFALSKKYSPYKLNQLAEKDAYFADCLEFARYVLLYGMEIRVLESEKMSQFAYQWLRDHHRWWDKDYRKHWEEMLELRKQSKEEQRGTERVIYQEVVIPDFGTSGMVPDKPKEDND